jgi:hypothetical protein
MNLRSRLEKLETGEQSGVVYIWRNIDETDDQAVARWRGEHSGQENGHRHVVVGWEKEPSSIPALEKEGSK